MHRLFSNRAQSLFTAAVLAAAFVVAMYVVQGERAKAALPSSKFAVAVGEIIDLEAAAASADEGPIDVDSSGWKKVMKTGMQVNSQGDLAMDLSMQCALLTDTTVKSMNGTLDTSEAQAGIRFRIAIYKYTDDGSLPLGNKVGYATPENDVIGHLATTLYTPGDGVTFCDRYQKLAAKFSGLNCAIDAATGKLTCLEPEELQLVISTLDAHSFNFFYTDLASGRYWVVVEGKADAAALDQAGARAMAGLGSLAVEKVRLVKGAELITGID